MQILSKKILKKIKRSIKCRNRLAYDLGKTAKTIDNYVTKNSPLLTSATALNAIRDEFKIPETEEILEEVK